MKFPPSSVLIEKSSMRTYTLKFISRYRKKLLSTKNLKYLVLLKISKPQQHKETSYEIYKFFFLFFKFLDLR